MGFRIIVDSASDAAQAVKNRLTVIPMTVSFGREEYLDGVTIDYRMFYEKLAASHELPKTSQVPPAEFARVFREVEAAGDSAVVITIGSQLSGTYQSARLAASDFENIYVVDSKTVTLGIGVLAEMALALADQGMTAEEIAQTLTRERENVRIVALLDTLEYLKKGGRISGTAAFVGGVLSIKPVVLVEDGVVKTLGKARGTKQGNQLITKEVEKLGGIDLSKPMLLGYSGMDPEPVERYIAENSALWEHKQVEVTGIGCAIGTHVGPGAHAVAFFKK